MLHFKKLSKACLKGSIVIYLFFVISNASLEACTAFYIKTKDKILVGNNEDSNNPETKIWTVPGEKGSYGRMYFGFNDLSAQGGINEKGLWFDAFGLPFQSLTSAQGGEIYPGDLQDKLMAGCATVEDVIRMLKLYKRPAMTRYQWMFGDKTGKSAIVEGDTIILMHDNYKVITNFRQSQFPSGKGFECNRYPIANEMLKTRPNPDMNYLRNILSSTHSEGQDVTLYSYIADLTNGLVYVYHFHNFENVVVLDVRKELSKGKHIYNLPELFPRTNVAESFDYQARLGLKQLKASRLDKKFVTTTYPQYYGRYIISTPESMEKQVITIKQGVDCLHLHLNDGGPYEVIPESDIQFVLLSYGGMELKCKFKRDLNSLVNELDMEGGGLSILAKRID